MPVTHGAAVRAQLGKILSSPVFVNSPRMSRFLQFVVETTLDGKSESIKEYVIAIEVFEKAEDYDPQADSTVRTEASKLRSRLSQYYDTEGRDDPMAITIPKGSYVPKFEDRKNGEMLTGQRLFEGDTVSDTLAAVLKETPDWNRVPARVRTLVRRCLERDPKRRLRDIGDAMPLVENEASVVTSSQRHSWVAWGVAAVF